jgi:hypothetical protein
MDDSSKWGSLLVGLLLLLGPAHCPCEVESSGVPPALARGTSGTVGCGSWQQVRVHHPDSPSYSFTAWRSARLCLASAAGCWYLSILERVKRHVWVWVLADTGL